MIVELASINRLYGHGAILKAYAGLPPWLPLPFAVQHGWPAGRPPDVRSAESAAGLGTVWTWTRELADGYQRLGMNALAGGAPFVYACGLQTGRPSLHGAAGTLAFPAHATRDVRMTGDFEAYVRAFGALPSDFQPVTFCLHPSELGGAVHQVLQAKNLRVISNGSPTSPQYLHKFIANVRSHRYVTSNIMSTALLYAAFVGVPGFMFGAEFTLENVSDPHVPRGPLHIQHEALAALRPIFSLEGMTSPEAQSRAARGELGADVLLSAREIRDHVRETYQRMRLRRYLMTTTVRVTSALVRRLRRS